MVGSTGLLLLLRAGCCCSKPATWSSGGCVMNVMERSESSASSRACLWAAACGVGWAIGRSCRGVLIGLGRCASRTCDARMPWSVVGGSETPWLAVLADAAAAAAAGAVATCLRSRSSCRPSIVQCTQCHDP
jgi:hypothetical protein